MKKVFLSFFLCLLITSTANAEYAWVLWKRTTVNFDETSRRWEIIIAVPTYEKCMVTKSGLIENEIGVYRKISKSVDLTSTDHIVAVIEDAKNQRDIVNTLDYYCFPDTVDPRK